MSDDRFKLVFTDDIMQRIQIPSANDIRVDVHQLSVKETQRLLKNLIALDFNGFNLTVIHGYNHGTSLKKMLWNDFNGPRIIDKKPVEGNPGQTVLSIANAV